MFLKIGLYREGIRQPVKVTSVIVIQLKSGHCHGGVVLNWIMPSHWPLPLGCLDKIVCSNDGTLDFEGFYFCYPQNHSHLLVLYV